MKISERLRKTISEIRRKSYPITDLIPLLDAAATALEQMERNEISKTSK